MKRLGIDGAATIRRVALGVSSRMVFVVFMLGTALLTYSDDSVAEMDRLVSYLVYGAAVVGVAAAMLALWAHRTLQNWWPHADAEEQAALQATRWSAKKWRTYVILYGLGVPIFAGLGGWFWWQAFWLKKTLQTARAKQTAAYMLAVLFSTAAYCAVIAINAYVMRRRRLHGD